MAYKIIVDSTCDLPDSLLTEYDIKMLPLSIHFKDQTYRDRVDIDAKTFYELLAESDELPKTSQITPRAFIEAFEEELAKGNEVVCVTIASAASGTYQSAVLAKEQLESDQIHIIDSEMLCMGTGLLALYLADAFRSGKKLHECTEKVDFIKGHMEQLFTVDTLKYLKKGGRIKPTTATIGEILNIHPLLNVDKGITQTIGKVRGNKQVYHAMLDHMDKDWDEQLNPYIAIGHGCDLSKAEKLSQKIRDKFNYKGKIIYTEIGSTIGAHAGPGVLSVFYVKP